MQTERMTRGPGRTGLLGIALAICVGIYQGWFSTAYDHLTTAALSEDARGAIEVRCNIPNEGAAGECRRTLKKLFLAGTLDPDTTLRAYCEAVKSGTWDGNSRTAPPKLCLERSSRRTAG